MSTRVEAPWTTEQVENLKKFQADDRVHAFTSSTGEALIPTEAGWVLVDGGPVIQTWAWDFMLSWPEAMKTNPSLSGEAPT